MNDAMRQKIVDLPALLPLLDKIRAQNLKVVQCHGCFDVVHPGHIRHLLDAKEQGDVLVVSVTADRQIDKPRGAGVRPFVPQELRCENLAALTMVDFVIVDGESWAGPILEQIRPNIYVKGLEYSNNDDPRFLKEKEIVERNGGEVVFTSGAVVYSSSVLQRDRMDARDLHEERIKAFVQRHGITRESLIDRLKRFQDLHVVIIGDPLLDHYVECEQVGASSEAPILQVSPMNDRYFVGGAGVLALHAVSLGAEATIVGFFGPSSPPIPDIQQVLSDRNVRVLSIAADEPLLKTRYLVEGQKVFKVDRCRPIAVTSVQENVWCGHVESAFAAGAQGLIAVDFGYGSLSHSRVRRAVQAARGAGAKVFGDVSSSRYASLSKLTGLEFDAIFPNEAEARSFLGEPEIGLPLLASSMFNHELAKVIALTMGPRGLVLFDRDRVGRQADEHMRYLPEYLPSLARVAVDPLGAGDALTTVASLALMAGGSLVESVFLGSIAAAVVVHRLGNEPVQVDDIIRFLNAHLLFL